MLTLVGSTLLLQANGVFVGLRPGPDPQLTLVVMTFVELDAVLAISEILETFEVSARVKRFIQKAGDGVKKSPFPIWVRGGTTHNPPRIARYRALFERAGRMTLSLE